MTAVLHFEPGRWFGWLEEPVEARHFGASPVKLTSVQPLKTGQGLLKLGFIQPLHQGGGAERTVVLDIVQRAETHITGIFDCDGAQRTAIIRPAGFEWMERHCAELYRRRPPQGPTWLVDGEPLGELSFDEYFRQLFGHSDRELLRGTGPESFKQEPEPNPATMGLLSHGKEYEPFDAWLISRGFTPPQMEDKWFIYLEAGRLLFRRSWTGILIYDVEAQQRGDKLYLGQVKVNRDQHQYGEADDQYDLAVLNYLVDRILRGLWVEFPAKGESETAPLEAWSTVGKSSLS